MLLQPSLLYLQYFFFFFSFFFSFCVSLSLFFSLSPPYLSLTHSLSLSLSPILSSSSLSRHRNCYLLLLSSKLRYLFAQNHATTLSQPTVRELRFGDDGCHGIKWPHHPHRRFPREWKNLVENILVELKQQSHENDELRLELEELRNTSTQQTQLLMDLTESVNRLVQTLVVSEKRRCPCAGSNPDRPERRGHGGGRRARGRNNNRIRGNQAPAPDFGTSCDTGVAKPVSLSLSLSLSAGLSLSLSLHPLGYFMAPHLPRGLQITALSTRA
ncbi:unnamed protein product [Acanthosepion pharaonis]|uniref:Uncharacterized protein n=1 Tax=Acanthosepion pharaonis TaxID=158019 RepID=A0A812AZU6_ACAPH|nr:unnamed protein product [Sepia pharaonis]